MQSPADVFGEVFRAIWAHKLRAFLTMFGIAWGVGSMLFLMASARASVPGSAVKWLRWATMSS